MAVEILMRLDPSGSGLVPADVSQLEAMSELRHGDIYRATLVKPRNPKFHRLVFALIKYAYELWEPAPMLHNGREVERSMESFRAEFLILAGHYSATHRIDGGVRLKAKSISFARCDETEFRRVFSGLINTALKHIPAMSSMTPDQLERAVNEVLRFEA